MKEKGTSRNGYVVDNEERHGAPCGCGCNFPVDGIHQLLLSCPRLLFCFLVSGKKPARDTNTQIHADTTSAMQINFNSQLVYFSPVLTIDVIS